MDEQSDHLEEDQEYEIRWTKDKWQKFKATWKQMPFKNKAAIGLTALIILLVPVTINIAQKQTSYQTQAGLEPVTPPDYGLRIVTESLPKAYLDSDYRAVVTGRDDDLDDELQIDFQGLPEGLVKTDCKQSLNRRTKTIKVDCEIAGQAVKQSGISYPQIYQVKAVLSDSEGNQTQRTFDLIVEESSSRRLRR